MCGLAWSALCSAGMVRHRLPPNCHLCTACTAWVLQVPWNPVHNAQAMARIYRIGQTRPTFVYRLLYKNTMVGGWQLAVGTRPLAITGLPPAFDMLGRRQRPAHSSCVPCALCWAPVLTKDNLAYS